MLTYRRLNFGEKLQEGDEWYYHNTFYALGEVGETYHEESLDEGWIAVRPLDPLLFSLAQEIYDTFVYLNNALTPEQVNVVKHWKAFTENLL